MRSAIKLLPPLVVLMMGCSRASAPVVKSLEPPPNDLDLDVGSGLGEGELGQVGDDLITRAVERELAVAPGVPGDRLEVRTNDGVVELRGVVPHRLAKERAVRVAQGVVGVRAVVDLLDVERRDRAERDQEQARLRAGQAWVRRGDLEPPTDGEILAALTTAAEMSPWVDADALDVAVADGAVTLSGTVPDLRARRAAGDVARNVIGVRSVRNQLRVRPGPTSDRALAAQVEAALARSGLVSAGAVEVDVSNRRAILSGVVSDTVEMVDATAIAVGVPGIREVENDMVVIGAEVPEPYEPYWAPYSPYAYPTDPFTEALGPESDATLADDLRRELRDSLEVEAENVGVSVVNGVVTLTGSVHTPRAREAAEHSAYRAGARLVRNHLELLPE